MHRLLFAVSFVLLAFAGGLLASPSPGSAPKGSEPQNNQQVRAVELWYGVYEPGEVEIVEDKNNPAPEAADSIQHQTAADEFRARAASRRYSLRHRLRSARPEARAK